MFYLSKPYKLRSGKLILFLLLLNDLDIYNQVQCLLGYVICVLIGVVGILIQEFIIKI
ncbi:hypothetical protein IFVP5_C190204 [Vibrio parahaemolyticus]